MTSGKERPGQPGGLLRRSLAVAQEGDTEVDAVGGDEQAARDTTGSRLASPTSERRAQQLVAVSFFLLAPYIAVEAVRALAASDRAESSIIGLVLTAGTAVFEPALGLAKRRIGARLGSSATAGEGSQNLQLEVNRPPARTRAIGASACGQPFLQNRRSAYEIGSVIPRCASAARLVSNGYGCRCQAATADVECAH